MVELQKNRRQDLGSVYASIVPYASYLTYIHAQ
jgi:hypothetical protein